MSDLAVHDVPTYLAALEHARRDLAVARTPLEARGVRERAGALKDVAARQVRLDESQGIRTNALDVVLDGAEVWIDAYRKEGLLLREMQESGERLGQKDGDNQWVRQHAAPTTTALGYSDTKQVTRAMRVSDPPESTVDDYKLRQREKREPCSLAGLIRFWIDSMRRGLDPIALPIGTYRTIVIDPPWPMGKSVRVETPEQGSELEYPTMSVEEIKALPIAERSATGTHLYLWVTQRFLPDGLEIVKAWDFKYHCLLTWLKPGGFAPFSWMFNTEHVIFAYRGDFEIREMGLNIGFQAPRGAHSQKPDHFYELVERASFEPRLEMFARRDRPGWSVWGDEV